MYDKVNESLFSSSKRNPNFSNFILTKFLVKHEFIDFKFK